MAAQFKLFGGLLLLLVILAAVYFLVFSFFNFGSRGESALKINGREIKIEIADNPLARARGLAGRDGIGDDEGMLFVFNEPAIQRFWMKGMRFSIDIIWIRENTVVGFEENVPAEPGVSDENLKIYSSPEVVEKVLEMKAGSVRAFDIKIGDRVEF